MMWVLAEPVFSRIRYSILLKKFKKLDERLKSEREQMDVFEKIRILLKCCVLRGQLGIESNEELSLVRPPTLKSLVMEAWRKTMIPKAALIAIFIFFQISMALTFIFHILSSLR